MNNKEVSIPIDSVKVKPPQNMTNNASLVNFGINDKPVWYYVDFISSKQSLVDLKKNIIKLTYFNVLDSSTYDLSYTTLNEQDLTKVFDELKYKISLYPGDKTVIVNTNNARIILFNVLKQDRSKFTDKYANTFYEVNTINLNQNNELVSDDELYVCLGKPNVIMLYNNYGVEKFHYANTVNRIEDILFINRQNGFIHTRSHIIQPIETSTLINFLNKKW